MSRPLIGISTSHGPIAGAFSHKVECSSLSTAFISLVQNAGGIPLGLSPVTSITAVGQIAQSIGGLLLSSGEDISPSLYGETSQINYDRTLTGMGVEFHRPQGLSPSLLRDEFELQLYREMRKLGKPIFGICRGLQMINVAEGGTLHQELPPSSIEHGLEPDGWVNYHSVRVEEASACFRYLKQSQLFMPSVHHQGIHQLASSLTASAKSDDGLIEMIELRASEGFVIGVQGHIEKVTKNIPIYNALVSGFVAAATGRRE